MIAAELSAEERLILECLRRDVATVANRPDVNGAQGLADELGICVRPYRLATGDVCRPDRTACMPLVYRQLKSAAGIAPESLAPMRSEFYGNALSNLHLTRELARLAGLLSATSIEAIAFKGPILALQAWGDLALRQFNDLDLLVHAADAARVVDLLIEDGYRAAHLRSTTSRALDRTPVRRRVHAARQRRDDRSPLGAESLLFFVRTASGRRLATQRIQAGRGRRREDPRAGRSRAFSGGACDQARLDQSRLDLRFQCGDARARRSRNA